MANLVVKASARPRQNCGPRKNSIHRVTFSHEATGLGVKHQVNDMPNVRNKDKKYVSALIRKSACESVLKESKNRGVPESQVLLERLVKGAQKAHN